MLFAISSVLIKDGKGLYEIPSLPKLVKETYLIYPAGYVNNGLAACLPVA